MFLKNIHKNGFTLLELLIVMGIIGFVSTVSIYSIGGWSNKKYLDKTVSGFINSFKGARAEAISSNKGYKFTFSNANEGIELKYYKEEYPSGLSNCNANNWIIDKSYSSQIIKNNGKVLALVCDNNNCTNKLSEICFTSSGSATSKIIEFQLNDMYLNYNPKKIDRFLTNNNFELIATFKFPFMQYEDRIYINKK